MEQSLQQAPLRSIPGMSQIRGNLILCAGCVGVLDQSHAPLSSEVPLWFSSFPLKLSLWCSS